jgi:hypothetical protein
LLLDRPLTCGRGFLGLPGYVRGVRLGPSGYVRGVRLGRVEHLAHLLLERRGEVRRDAFERSGKSSPGFLSTESTQARNGPL